MLSSLMVKNFAIIDNINIEFSSGFTAITGETGAGKSLIIDAIGLLLGDRASTSMIRSGESKAIVEGVFTDLSNNTISLLKEYDIYEDENLIIKKEININGKTTTRINGYAVSVTQLEEIANTLADIHTQNDTKKLFEPKNYLDFIDDKESLELLKEYQCLRNEYFVSLKKYKNILDDIDNYQKDKDYLQYQYDILVNANLKEEELENLEEEFELMSNYDLIFKNFQIIKNTFADNNITSSLYSICNNLEKIAKFDVKYNKILQVIKNSYYELNDSESEISQQLNKLEFDENYFREVVERINFLKDLQYKYKKNIKELIEYRDELNDKLNILVDDKVLIEDSFNETKKLFDNTLTVAKKLTNLRKTNALNLVSSIKQSLKDLMLNKVDIEISFNDKKEFNLDFNVFPKQGIDEVNILISFNPGEQMKDLSKVASGGEMSRVMLAIKTHLMKNLGLSTMIFDEIDSGISGEVAYQVAKKLFEISKHTQVFSITHLPIVASIADNHLFISKKVIDERTVTEVIELDNQMRINEIAKMISPNDESGINLELAVNMLKNK